MPIRNVRKLQVKYQNADKLNILRGTNTGLRIEKNKLYKMTGQKCKKINKLYL